MKNDYKEVTEDLITEVLGTLSSINDLLILTGYYQNSPETNHYLSLISKCISKSQEMASEAKNRLTAIPTQ
jgi:hypothetical protein